jgi:hypothetical protein
MIVDSRSEPGMTIRINVLGLAYYYGINPSEESQNFSIQNRNVITFKKEVINYLRGELFFLTT